MRKRIVGLLVLTMMTLSACVSQDDYDALVKQNTKLEDKIDDLDSEISNLEKELKEKKDENEDLNEQYDELSTMYDALAKDMEQKADSEGLSILKEELSDYGNVDVFESVKGKGKVLDIVLHFNVDQEDTTDLANKIGTYFAESWFDYDYVTITMWNDTLGVANTMVVNLRMRTIDSHSWIE